jgi:hypothetical protein
VQLQKLAGSIVDDLPKITSIDSGPFFASAVICTSRIGGDLRYFVLALLAQNYFPQTITFKS